MSQRFRVFRKISHYKEAFFGKPAIVLGNGESRKVVNLNGLFYTNAVVIGCNAIYRDFAPHFLVSVDRNISLEILESGYAKSHNYLVGENVLDTFAVKRKKFVDCMEFPGLIINDVHNGWASGNTALRTACYLGCSPVYLLGFDSRPLDNSAMNNVYKGTENYAKADHKTNVGPSWMKQFDKLKKEYPTIDFYQAGTDRYSCETVPFDQVGGKERRTKPQYFVFPGLEI